MAHFAEIDENNIVVRVLVVPDEQEHRGQEYLANELGLGGRWIQTSYNNNFRKIYASIGYLYLEEYDIFIEPKPYESWNFDEIKLTWVAPIEKPDAGFWLWNEESKTWHEFEFGKN